MTRRPFDPGLQLERTELAWRRTALSIALAALVAVRLLPPVLGPWAFGAGLAGLGTALLLGVLARARAERAAQALLDGDRAMPGGGLLLALAALVLAGAVLGVAYVTAAVVRQ